MSSSPGLVSSTARHVRRAAADRAENAVTSAADRARQRARGARKPHTCSCGGKDCPGSFRTLRAQKAHAAKHSMAQAGRWTSKAARAAERRMGKPLSDARRHAVNWLEAAGHKEWRKVPIRDQDGKPRTRKDGSVLTREVPADTAKALSRPEVGSRPKLGDLRQADRHDRHHEKAAERRIRAAHHTGKAGRARTPAGRLTGKVRTASAARHVRKADDLEARWPARQAAPARPASPARTPAPARSARPARPSR